MQRRRKPISGDDGMNFLLDWLSGFAGAYLVGGCVRDLLLGRTPTDYDIVFLEDPDACARMLAAATGGRVVEIGKSAFRVWRVVTAKEVIDVAPAAGANLTEDLCQRDFTINALAIHAATGQVIDATGGRNDLSAGIIRMVSDAAFRADPVRLLRAFRFAAGLGFSIDPATCTAIARDAALIARSAGERIRAELFKLLSAGVAYPQVVTMREAGLLQAMFPALEPSGIDFGLRSLQALEFFLNGFPSFPSDLAAGLNAEFHEQRRVLLKCAALLRPIVAPRQTGVLARLRLSRRDAARLERLMRPVPLPREFALGTVVSASEELRFFRMAGGLAPDFLMQALAVDPKDAARPAMGSANILRMLHHYFFRYRPKALSPPPITGKDLIDEFGLRPSRRFKRILDLVDEARLAREAFTRADALALVRAHLDEGL
jgi:tRNA nucleotidyltransferase/poly(A) polymerase